MFIRNRTGCFLWLKEPDIFKASFFFFPISRLWVNIMLTPADTLPQAKKTWHWPTLGFQMKYVIIWRSQAWRFWTVSNAVGKRKSYTLYTLKPVKTCWWEHLLYVKTNPHLLCNSFRKALCEYILYHNLL